MGDKLDLLVNDVVGMCLNSMHTPVADLKGAVRGLLLSYGLPASEQKPTRPMPADASSRSVAVVRGYEELLDVLVAALDQAQSGKGAERHANNLPFTEQPMQTISKLVGSGDGMTYQVIKKLQESNRMPERSARDRERLGAIVYTAGLILFDKE